MLSPGLYEQVINTALNRELSEIPEARKSVAPIDQAKASKVLAQYLADVVQKGLENVVDNGGDISTQISLANQIVAIIQNTTQEADFAVLGVDQRAEQLLALLRMQDPSTAHPFLSVAYRGKMANKSPDFSSLPDHVCYGVHQGTFQQRANKCHVVLLPRLCEIFLVQC